VTAHSKTGFALVDILVALAVLGLIATSLTGLTRFSMQQLLHAEKLKGDSENIAAARRIFSALVERAPSFNKGDKRQPVIKGTKSSLQIWSYGPPILALASPRLITLAQEENNGKKSLNMRWTEQGGAEESETIIANIARLEFEYFLSAVEDTKAKWGWSSSLPVPPYRIGAVKLKLRLPEKREETIFVYQVLATMPQSCTTNPGRFGCP